MASSFLGTDNMDDDDYGKTKETPFYEDDATEAAGSNRERNDAVAQEINVKWQMQGHHDVSSAKRLLQELLAYLMIYHPGDVIFIDSKQREWTFDEEMDADLFVKKSDQLAIQIHPIKNKERKVIRWIAITRIRAYSTIQEWKNEDHFYSHVDATKTYMFPHPFAHDAWDTVTIGFIKDIHAIHYPKDLLNERLNELLQKQNKNFPTYQLIPQRITDKEKQASTKAYTVHCLKEDATQLLQLLTHGSFRDAPNQIFVPFKYKSQKPDLFMRCIRQQNETYHKTWIIKIEGITPEAMNFIQHDIDQIRGVLHIVPSKRMHEIGEWKILVDQSKCSYIHRQLSKSWEAIVKQVPTNILDDAPITFSVPSISSKRPWEYQETESDNDSYGSILTTGTNVSVMTNDDELLNDLPSAYKFPSYASAAANSTKSGETQFSSPTTSVDTAWKKEKEELEAQIRAQAEQIERIQADLQTKISRSKDLEDQLAQAIELAHTRDARHEEMLAKFEQLMKVHTDAQTRPPTDETDVDSSSSSMPTTPDRVIPPPPKKPNINSSPHRNIYSIFRQQATRPNSPRPRKISGSMSTQPMETDEDPRQPILGAKPSKKQE